MISPADDVKPLELRHRHQVLALFGGVLLVRLIAVLACPMDLAGDEAYYWEWGQHPAAGYYSKPPGIAWIMALAGWLGNNSVLGIRLAAVLFSMGSGMWIYLLARHLRDQRTGLLAAALFFVTPAAAGLSYLLTIDSPLMFFWSGALYFLLRITCSRDSTTAAGSAHYLGLALCIGAGILVKQMMLVFPVLALISILASKNKIANVRPALLLAALVTPLLALLPPIGWNARNGWPTLHHTGEHFTASDEHGVAAIAGRLLEFLGSQLALASPVIAVLVAIFLVLTLRRWKSLDSAGRSLWLFSAPVLLLMTLGNLTQRINPNWPAVFYVAALVLAALNMPSKWKKPALYTGVGFCTVIYLCLALASWRIGPAPLLEKTQRGHGWSKLASEVENLRAKVPRPADTIVVTRSHRFLTSQLAFNLPDHPRVYRYLQSDIIESQHAFWSGPENELGSDALIVTVGSSRSLPKSLQKQFSRVEKLADLENFSDVAGGPVSVFLGHELLSWPSDAAKKSSAR